MPEFVITGPDGKKYRVTSPNNVSAEETQSTLAGAISQFASSGVAGTLRTLDVIPQALASVGNIAGWATGGGSPGFDPTPFRNVGRFLGLGERRPETPVEKATGFAGEMVGATAIPAGLAMRAAAPAARMRTLGIEGASLGGAVGGGLVGEQMGGAPGQLVGTIAGGLAPAAAPFVAGKLVAPAGQRQMQANLAAAERAGVPLSAGQAAGGSFIEKGSATLPGGQALAQQFAQKQAATMGARVKELTAPMAAEASQEAAGRAIREGLAEFTNEFRSRGNELYGAVHALIPKQTPVALNRTRGKLDDLVMDEEFSQILDAPMVRQLQKLLGEKQAIPYEVAHGIRSRIGEKLSGSELIANAPKGQLKALYASLSQDLDDVATAIGPQAEQAAKRASNYWRSGMKRIDDFLDPIQKRKIPEKVYAAAMAGTNEGASRLRTLKRSLKPEQWDTVAGTAINRLGRVQPSSRVGGELLEESADFSPESFLTNLERMDAKAREILFSGTRYEALERSMTDLRRVASAMRSQRMTAYNPSGTAAGLWNTAGMALPTMGAMANMPFARDLALGLGANMALQKGLQSPGMVNWLARPTAFQPSVAPLVARPYAYLQQ